MASAAVSWDGADDRDGDWLSDRRRDHNLAVVSGRRQTDWIHCEGHCGSQIQMRLLRRHTEKASARNTRSEAMVGQRAARPRAHRHLSVHFVGCSDDTIEEMSVSMDWVCVVKQDGKHLHTALGYTAEEAKSKADIWREKHAGDFPDAAIGRPRLQFPKSA
jgi:hypothetical protein